MNLDITSMLNNQFSVDFLNYSNWYPLFHIYYGKKGTDNFYRIYIEKKNGSQYMQYPDLNASGIKFPKSLFSDRLKGFYTAVIL